MNIKGGGTLNEQPFQHQNSRGRKKKNIEEAGDVLRRSDGMERKRKKGGDVSSIDVQHIAIDTHI